MPYKTEMLVGTARRNLGERGGIMLHKDPVTVFKL